jgi:hypothetical protein
LKDRVSSSHAFFSLIPLILNPVLEQHTTLLLFFHPT